MTTIFVILCICGICRLLKGTAERKQAERAKRERQKIREWQEQIREEQAAQRERQRRIAEEQREYARRQAEHDKEIARAAREREALRREQERQRKEQARLAEEQRKQAFAIRDLQYRMKVCEEDHKAIMQKLENLRELHELVSRNMEAADRAGDDKAKAAALRKIISIDNQIAAAERKERECRYKWNTAKQKLAS